MNPNPTDIENNPMVVDADYSLNDAYPSIVFVYKGLGQNAVGLNLEFRTKDNKQIVYKPVNYKARRLAGQAGGRRKSKSKRRKTKRRKSRKNKSRRRR
jgi:hypothetical protein